MGKRKNYRKDSFEEKETNDLAKEILNFSRQVTPLDQVMKNEYAYNFMPLVSQYTPEQVSKMMNDPKTYQKQLRAISKCLMGVSPQYQNLVSAIPKMCLFRPVIVPILNKETGGSFKENEVERAFIKASNKLLKMNISEEFLKATLQMSKYDTFFGYEIETSKNYFIKALNPDYCRISSFDSCLNFEFDFSYFTANEELLKSAYPSEFEEKYLKFKNDSKLRWQELNSNKTLCVKWFNDELGYSLPPYMSLFDDLYNLKDYKGMNKDKVRSDLLKMLIFKIPLNSKSDKPDNFLLSKDMIKVYMSLLNQQLPSSVSAVTTPMGVDEVNFQQATTQIDEIAKAERQLFSSSAFAPALFGVDASGSALEYSTKYNLGKTFSIYRQFETWLNRKFNKLYNGKVHIKLLDITTFNEDQVQEKYLQGSQMSVPVKTLYTASLGLQPAEILGLNYLENKILNTQENWQPLNSSHTQSSVTGNSVGRPKKDTEDLTDAGETTRIRDDNNK